MKKWLCLLAAICMAAALCGCGGSAEPGFTAPQVSLPNEGIYKPVTALDSIAAQQLLDVYNTYSNFGVCAMEQTLTQGETFRQVLLAGCQEEHFSSFVVKKVPCCHSFEQMLGHVLKYLSVDLVAECTQFENNPVAYEGDMYAIVGAMGYGGYYMLDDLTDNGDGTATVTVRYDYETQDHCASFALEDGNWKLQDIT